MKIMKLLRDIFKGLFSRQKAQPEKQPEPHIEPQKKTGAFHPTRTKPPGRWIKTVNRIQRTKSKKVWKRRAKNKVARKSNQINRRKAA